MIANFLRGSAGLRIQPRDGEFDCPFSNCAEVFGLADKRRFLTHVRNSHAEEAVALLRKLRGSE